MNNVSLLCFQNDRKYAHPCFSKSHMCSLFKEPEFPKGRKMEVSHGPWPSTLRSAVCGNPHKAQSGEQGFKICTVRGPQDPTKKACLSGDKKADLLLLLLLLEHAFLSSCSTRGHVFLFNKKTCLAVEQEGMCSCSEGRHVFLLNKQTCLPDQQRRHVSLFNKKTCFLVQQEDMFPCSTRTHA